MEEIGDLYLDVKYLSVGRLEDWYGGMFQNFNIQDVQTFFAFLITF